MGVKLCFSLSGKNMERMCSRTGCRRDWRTLRNEELHKLPTSQNIIRVIKLRMVKWAELVARMGGMKTHTKLSWNI
jgi:hypothetical protein